jgi:NAD(P)-dependent dehydrogenase (short-subunit alcohol dehydrogenase family)
MPPERFRLAGKVALITGASRGLEAGLAQLALVVDGGTLISDGS